MFWGLDGFINRRIVFIQQQKLWLTNTKSN